MTRLTDHEERKQQEASIIRPGFTNENPALGEVDLELSSKRQINRTEEP